MYLSFCGCARFLKISPEIPALFLAGSQQKLAKDYDHEEKNYNEGKICITVIKKTFIRSWPVAELKVEKVMSYKSEFTSANPVSSLKSILAFREMAVLGGIGVAAEALGITRVTFRDHLRNLEAYFDTPLYVPRGRGIVLTETGQKLHERTDAIIVTLRMLLAESLSDSRHSLKEMADLKYFQQRHGLQKIKRQTPLIRRGFEDYAASEGKLDHERMSWLWEHFLVYRRVPEGWLCINVGKRSSYATWLGKSWAMGAVGKLSSTDPTGETYDLLATEGYNEVWHWGAPRLDHLHTAIVRRRGGEKIWVSYQRALFLAQLPNDEHPDNYEPVIVSLVARTNQIEIDALRGRKIQQTAAVDLMDGEPDDRPKFT